MNICSNNLPERVGVAVKGIERLFEEVLGR